MRWRLTLYYYLIAGIAGICASRAESQTRNGGISQGFLRSIIIGPLRLVAQCCCICAAINMEDLLLGLILWYTIASCRILNNRQDGHIPHRNCIEKFPASTFLCCFQTSQRVKLGKSGLRWYQSLDTVEWGRGPSMCFYCVRLGGSYELFTGAATPVRRVRL